MANQEILDFIGTERRGGKTDEEIRQKAVEKGWNIGDINGAFATLALASNPLTARTTSYVSHKKKSYVPQVIGIVVLLFVAIGAYAMLPVIRASVSNAIATTFDRGVVFTNEPFVPFASTPDQQNAHVPNVLDKVASLLTLHSSLPSTPATNPSSGGTGTNPAATVPATTQQTTPSIPFIPSLSSFFPEPSVQVHANYTSVQPGDAVTISWSSTNASSCRASAGFSTGNATSGSAVAHPVLSTSYSVTCIGSGGTKRESVFVTVSADAPAVPSTDPNTPTAPTDPTPPLPDPVPPVVDPDPPTSTSTPSQPPATPPPAPVIPTGTYAVYQGCESPSSNYARTLYFDPVNGNDTTGDGSQAKPLQSVAVYAAARKFASGDHIVLLPGQHPALAVSAKTPALLGSSWVWLDFRPGAVLDSISINGVGRWLITNGAISHPAGGISLVALTGAHDVILADSDVYTDTSNAGWTATKWISGTDTGVFSDSSTCLSFLRNDIYNVRHGLTVSTRTGSPNPALNSIKALIERNVIKNHSGDGLRPLGSDIIVSYNSILDEYVSQADGDGNHDDGIQGFALPAGTVYGNVTIDHNWVQETTNPNRAFNAGMQGISSFDGVYTNLRITNNVVITSVYHGISWYGVNNTLIDHNTVVNWSTDGYTNRIYVPIGKSSSGSPAPYNVTLSNNVAGKVSGDTAVVLINNYNYGGQEPVGLFATLDPANNRYDLRPKIGGPLDGKNIGADLTQAIALDRPSRAEHIAQAPDEAPATPQLAAAEAAHPGFLAWILQNLAAFWQGLLHLLGIR